MESWLKNEHLIPLLLVLLILAAAAWAGSRIKYCRYKRRIDEAELEKQETSRRRYVTAKMKEHILERDNATCQICGISKGYLDSLAPGLGDYLLLEIDHITPVKQGGSGSDESNLQVLCWRCNRKKSGTRTNEEVAAMIDYGIEPPRRRRRLFR